MDRHAVGRVARGGVELELLVAELALPGHRQRLGPGQAERARPLHVVLVVEGAQLALGRPGLGAQALRGGLAAADAASGKA